MSAPRGWLLARFAELQIALMTLTLAPAGGVRDPAPGMAAAAWAFPLIGVLVGGVGAVGYALALATHLAPAFAAFVAIAVGILVTGAIHEDGLADAADGLGGHDRARKLAIMRDSQVGSYGILALILSLTMRGVCIASVDAPIAVACGLVALAAASRAAMVIVLFTLPPARSDGLGQAASGVGPAQCGVAAVIGLAALVALTDAWFPVAVAIIAVGALIAWLARRHLGGQTGDVLGAVQQCTEVVGWAAVAAWASATA